MTILIRKATENDIQSILRIERLSQVSPWTLEAFQRCFENSYLTWVCECSMGKSEFSQAENTTGIVGFVTMSWVLDEGHILNLAVSHGFQKQGLGFKLLQTAHDYAKQKNLRTIFLEVRATNLAAKKLYEKMGYIQIGARQNYYETVSGREDAIVMECVLQET